MPINRCLLIAALIVALFVVPASGAGSNSTKIVVSLKLPAFHGKLTSPRQACLGSREVKLYRKKPGPDKRLGKDTTEDNGKWSIVIGRKKVPSGTYYLTVSARGKCRAAKSNPIPVA